MFFKDIVGQEQIKAKLIQEVAENRIPHAQLFYGKEGTGKLALAIAYAQYLCCSNKQGNDSCGVCLSCVKFSKLAHPDLHFIYPVIKNNLSEAYLPEWRKIVLNNPYFSIDHWLQEINAENSQATIYSKESDDISQKLSLKSSEGSYKITIIWLPERMQIPCANKLLKLLEEPPQQTVFLLVTENADMLLPTIISRTQRVNIPKLSEQEIALNLQQQYSLSPADSQNIAHIADGNYIKALEAIHLDEENRQFFDLFVTLMRLSYLRKIKEMKLWSEQVAALGRERQKKFLAYCQHMIRENFICNFHTPEMNYMTREEEQFSIRFSPFVNEKNIMGIMHELSEAEIHIEQNVNSKIVFFDFALKMIMLLK